MDKQRNFEDCMQKLGDAFDAPLTEGKAAVYRKALIDLDPDKLRRATDRAIRELQFMPKPAQLRTYARDVVVQSKQEFSCHFHEDNDGRHRDRPAELSYHWCCRCKVFIRQGTQPPDDGKHERSGTRKLLEAMREDLGRPVASVKEGLAAAFPGVLEREPGEDDGEELVLF